MEQRPHLDLGYYGRWRHGELYVAEISSKVMGQGDAWHRRVGDAFVDLVRDARGELGAWVYDAFKPEDVVATLPANHHIYDAFVSYHQNPSDNIRSTIFLFGEHTMNKPFLDVPTLLIFPVGNALYDQYGTPIEKLDQTFIRVHAIKAITAERRLVYQFGRSYPVPMKAA